MHLQYLQQHSRGRRPLGYCNFYVKVHSKKKLIWHDVSPLTYRPAYRPDGWSTDQTVDLMAGLQTLQPSVITNQYQINGSVVGLLTSLQ